MSDEIRHLPIDRLFAHPDNPRLQLREDVVDRLAAEIKRTEFRPEHAILVRPHNTGWQIVSGHHRVEAAVLAELDEVPCWVREMDDDEAFMQLVLCNTQGELSRIEQAVHAYHFGERGHGLGRGQEGGLSEYARQLDRPRQRVSEQYAVGEVVERCRTSGTFGELVERDPYSQLIEVSKAPTPVQVMLVDHLLAKQWKVSDVRHRVQEIRKYEIPVQHAGWLPLADIIAGYLDNGRPTSTAVQKLITTADGILDHIGRDGITDDADQFRAWLVEHHGADSWDHRKLSEYHAALIRRWLLRGDRIRVVPSRAADLLDTAGLEPGSVDLIFTDPPYPVEFAECWTELGQLAVKALKPGGFLLAYTGQYTMLDAIDRLRDAGLTYYWCHAVVHDGAFFRMNATHVQCGWKPVLVFRNGPGDLPNWHKDVVTDGAREKASHEWQQAEAEAAYWISELSKPDQLVCDPFVGGGTTAVVCRDLGRRFIGCDVESAAVERTRERLA